MGPLYGIYQSSSLSCVFSLCGEVYVSRSGDEGPGLKPKLKPRRGRREKGDDDWVSAAIHGVRSVSRECCIFKLSND